MLTLILLNPDASRKPRTFHLDGQRPEVLGRHGTAVQLPDSRISRRHAEVSVQNGVWVIRDLGSSNGTRVNGQRITTLCELEEGDRLEIGRLTLIVGHVEVDLAVHDAIAATELDPDETGGAVTSADTLVQANPAGDDPDRLALQAAVDDDLEGAPSPLLGEPDAEPADQGQAEGVPDAAPLVAADLNTGDAADGVGPNDDSSIAPSDELEAAPALSEAEIEHLDGAAFDELDDEEFVAPSAEVSEEDDEDIYAESAGAITPVVSRPESPIDPAVKPEAAEADELVAEVDSETPASLADHLSTAELPEDAESDEAPEVVGLSLDMPAPEAENEAASAADDPDVQETRALDEDDALPLAPVSIDEELDAAIDDGMSAEFLASLDDEIDAADEQVTAELAEVAPEAVTGAAFTYDSATPEEPAGHGHELAEPEAMQKLADTSGPARRRWKAVAAVLLLGAVAGGGYWVTQHGMGPDQIAGREADRPATGADQQATPTGSEATVLPTPDAAVASSTNPLPDPTLAATAEGNAVDSSDAASTMPKVDAFGDGPTLTAPIPDPAMAAEVPAHNATSPMVVEPDTITTEQTTSDSVQDINPTEPSEPALAMLEPQPQEPWVPATRTTPDLTEPGDAAEQPAPAVASEPEPPTAEVADVTPATPTPGRRIAFLVDASGSMVDSMNQGVLTWLEGQIQSLDAADEFTVVFFRTNDVFEVPPAGLHRADDAARQDTIAWMSPQAGNIQPRGKSDPIDALRLAREYEATEVFILSDDKFGDRGTSLAAVDARDVAGFWVGRDVTFHTVQFYYPNDEDPRLQAIAQRFGGEYEFIEEPASDQRPGIDLFGVSQ